jgi:hypothetical protein
MKKISITLLLAVLCISAYAQNGTIAFMGIPIEGSFDDFCKELVVKKNLTPLAKDPSYQGLVTKGFKGDFWKFNGCTICVRRLVGSENVSSVSVDRTMGGITPEIFAQFISKYDELYGLHQEEPNALGIEYIWNFDGGRITVFHMTEYGEKIVIVYSNPEAVAVLDKDKKNVDDDL